MKVTLERINENYLFEAKGKAGVPIHIDNTSQEVAKGASPMELLLMGVGACSAIDVVSILKKQRQKIVSYRIEVGGERENKQEANVFKEITVSIYLEGSMVPEKAKKAADLSFEKYCSVSLTMEPCVTIFHQVFVNNELVL